MKTIISFFILIFFPFFLCSQTIIQAGDISGTWTLSGSPYLIEGNVTINDSATLNIESGVKIEFQNYYKFLVNGRLIAIGNVNDSIVFTVNDTSGFYNYTHLGWKGIWFNYASEIDSSHLKYCRIEYSKNGGFNIYNTNNLSITNTLVQNNYTGGAGGGFTINYSNPLLRNVLIQNNFSKHDAGGMYLFYTPTLDARNITIKNNRANTGGGVFIEYGNAALYDFIIEGNSAGKGGGIWSKSEVKFINADIFNNVATDGAGVSINGSLEIHNSDIYNNTAIRGNGGGIYVGSLEEDNSKIINCRIHNNHADYDGGGVYIRSYRKTFLQNSVIDSNTAVKGGGVCMWESSTRFEGLSIKNNHADYGGGICIKTDIPFNLNMDSTNLCSIYSNNGKIGKDLFSDSPGVEIRVDTFTVQNPTDYYAIPAWHFSFNIIHGLSTLINSDFYVATNGSDQNSGQSSSEAFKTIDHALSVLYTDSQNPVTLFIENGIYSPSATGETFPLTASDYLTIQGSVSTILDADSTDRILYSYAAHNQTINNLTLKNGKTNLNGGGLYIKNSTSHFDGIRIYNCQAKNGGGIVAYESDTEFSNTVLKNNTAKYDGGGIYVDNKIHHLKLLKVTISDNYANRGGGISLRGVVELQNVSLIENEAIEYGGAIYNFTGNAIFDTAFRSNIYANSAPAGNDFYNYSNNKMYVIVDTFTVIQPTAFHANPLSRFDFDILYGKTEQIWGDIFVSADGNNDNNGLSWESPFQTIRHALKRAGSNAENPIKLHLASGVYSKETNNESLPIIPIDHLKIIGHSQVVLDADSLTNILKILWLKNVSLKNLKLQNGFATDGGGMLIINSQTFLDSLTLTNNISKEHGGAIFGNRADITVSNTRIAHNKSENAGGIGLLSSTIKIVNTTIDSNSAKYDGGMECLYSGLRMTTSQITGNFDEKHTGGLLLFNTNATIDNSTFSGNKSGSSGTGAIYALDSTHLNLKNCIFWDEGNEWDIKANGSNYRTHLTISHSSLTDGERSIGKSGEVELNYMESNISGDPLFVGSGMFPYQIDEFSVCIDRGSPDTTGMNLPPFDLSANTRIVNQRIDMGAFEWNPLVDVEHHDKNKKSSELILYPNPAKTSLYLSGMIDEVITKVNVFNQLGQMVLQINQVIIPLDISNLQQGMYVIEVVLNKSRIRKKLIVTK